MGFRRFHTNFCGYGYDLNLDLFEYSLGPQVSSANGRVCDSRGLHLNLDMFESSLGPQVSSTNGRVCDSCGLSNRYYSLSPTNTSCDLCPASANCQGNQTDGFLLMPVDGYWHSSPFSPQFFQCT